MKIKIKYKCWMLPYWTSKCSLTVTDHRSNGRGQWCRAGDKGVAEVEATRCQASSVPGGTKRKRASQRPSCQKSCISFGMEGKAKEWCFEWMPFPESQLLGQSLLTLITFNHNVVQKNREFKVVRTLTQSRSYLMGGGGGELGGTSFQSHAFCPISQGSYHW